jgi:tetratricopeptide (TPR) repeat protein
VNSLRRVASLVLLTVFLATAVGAKESFGARKNVISLTRMNPAAVLILGTQIDVKVKPSGPKNQDLAVQLQSHLATELVEHDPRLVLESRRPQTRVEVDLLQNDYSSKWETRKERTARETGKDEKGRPVFSEAMVDVKYHLITHRFKVAYRVTEVASKKSLYADSIEVPFREEFKEGAGARTQSDLEANAMRQAVAQIVAQLTPTPEELFVLLPKGKLEDLGNFAEGGLWSRYAEALETWPAFPKADDESYRQYALGLAYEAMSYEADDVETTLLYLERAGEHYNQAINSNPKEDYFFKSHETALVVQGKNKLMNLLQRDDDPVKKVTAPPLERVQSALSKYQTIATQQATWNEALSGAGQRGGKTLTVGGPKTAPAGALTNQDIIDMARAGVDEELVLGTIADAKQCSFDTSAKALIELTKARVSKTIIKTLQEKACP